MTGVEGLREAIAEALCRHEFGAEFLDEQIPEWQQHFREGADTVLALPAFRDLLAAATRDAEAVKRVRELAEDDERCVSLLRAYATAASSSDERLHWNVMADVREQSAERIRRALGGPE